VPSLIDLLFVVGTVGAGVGAVIDFRRKRRQPQPLLSRITESGVVSPQWRQATSDAVAFEDLDGLAARLSEA